MRIIIPELALVPEAQFLEFSAKAAQDEFYVKSND